MSINIIKLFINICNITTLVLLELRFKTKNKVGAQFEGLDGYINSPRIISVLKIRLDHLGPFRFIV